MGSAPSKPAQTAPAEYDEKRLARSTSAVTHSSALGLRVPLSANGSLALSSVAAWEVDASANAKTRLARTILAHADIRSALIRRDAVIQDSHVFNTELQFKTNPVTNQKSSGRCWLFATTNVLRYQVMQKLDLKDFQLSQVCTRFLMGQIEGCL